MSGRTSFAACALLGLAIAACGGITAEAEDRTGVVQQPLTGVLAYRGVNLCGAEFGVDSWGNGSLPGTFGTTYTYPDPSYGYGSTDYFMSKGMTTFRLPFRWERLQPQRGQAFDSAEIARLRKTVNGITAKGGAVVLDPQNFARYGTQLIGSSAVPNAHFADLWSRLASEFKGSPNVLFGLVNEPHDIATEQWVSAANAAIAAIRATGATNLVLVPGNGWTGAHSWTSSYYGTPNSTALLGIVDSKNNYAFEVHQYLDDDASGGGSACVSKTIGSERMAAFTSWLRAHGKRGFLGEFGGPTSATCLSAIDDILKHVEANADVYLGWTYWAGGPWWGSYALSVEPSGSTDRAQMQSLLPHLRWAPASAPSPSPPPPAPTGACAPKTYDAETMAHDTGGAASGMWNLWSNGSLHATHTFGAGKTAITVKASGQEAGGTWPHMTVSVGGAVIGSATVGSTSQGSYSFTFDGGAGAKELRIAFDNDAVVGTADRNLLVESVTVGCAASACTAQSFEAETMSHSTGGATSGGWNLWSNGSAAATASLGDGETTIVVAAAGTYAGGAWPHFVVSVAGQTVGSATATSTAFRDYAFTFSGTAGTKDVRVTFDNDYASGSEDRNLLLDRVSVRCESP